MILLFSTAKKTPNKQTHIIHAWGIMALAIRKVPVMFSTFNFPVKKIEREGPGSSVNFSQSLFK